MRVDGKNGDALHVQAVARSLVRLAREVLGSADEEDERRATRKIKDGIDAPVVGARAGGGAPYGKASVLFVVSLDPKGEWENNILENSRYFRMRYDLDTGNLEQFVVSPDVAKRFRKRRVKSVDEVVAKVNKYIKDVT